jgi:tRNA modification GTPase
MHLDLSRTIVAISSPLAPALRAIVRISGSNTAQLLAQVLQASPSDDSVPQTPAWPHHFRARLDLAWEGRGIDVGVYYWPTQRSYTGEPCAELHVLGALPLINRIMQRLLHCGAQPAERGEFTLRSFLAGKIDLVQAEAVLGVIEADQQSQLEWALGQLAGNISQPVRSLRDQVVQLLAHLEAGLDFVEEDIEFISREDLLRQLQTIRDQIRTIASRLENRGVANREFELLLMGPPNAGKSSLFNALIGNQRAIVSPQAGTTRDCLSGRLESDSLSITVLDTAGIEEIAEDSPRALAQQAVSQRARSCDAILWCVDLSEEPSQESDSSEGSGPKSLPLSQHSGELLTGMLSKSAQQLPVIVVGTKADLASNEPHRLRVDHVVSVKSVQLLEKLRQAIFELVATKSDQRLTQATQHTAIRCYHALERAAESLTRALDLTESNAGEELIASELHCVLDDLSSIIGEVHNDDILGEIFSRFCIGK